MKLESVIFNRIALLVFFLVNLVAIYLLLRGHNYPGGGFIAGVASSVAIVLLSFATGSEAVNRILRMEPIRIAAAGLLLAVVVGMLPLFVGKPFLETFNYKWYGIPLIGELYLGTPLLFDIGVYLVVVGVTVKIVFTLMRSTLRLYDDDDAESLIYYSPLEEPVEQNPITGSEVFTEGLEEKTDSATSRNPSSRKEPR